MYKTGVMISDWNDWCLCWRWLCYSDRHVDGDLYIFADAASVVVILDVLGVLSGLLWCLVTVKMLLNKCITMYLYTAKREFSTRPPTQTYTHTYCNVRKQSCIDRKKDNDTQWVVFISNISHSMVLQLPQPTNQLNIIMHYSKHIMK